MLDHSLIFFFFFSKKFKYKIIIIIITAKKSVFDTNLQNQNKVLIFFF